MQVGRAVSGEEAPRRKIPPLFWREEFQTVCFNLFILKRALKLTRSVCLRAF
jgi:hypothetical protein